MIQCRIGICRQDAETSRSTFGVCVLNTCSSKTHSVTGTVCKTCNTTAVSNKHASFQQHWRFHSCTLSALQIRSCSDASVIHISVKLFMQRKLCNLCSCLLTSTPMPLNHKHIHASSQHLVSVAMHTCTASMPEMSLVGMSAACSLSRRSPISEVRSTPTLQSTWLLRSSKCLHVRQSLQQAARHS